MTSETLQPPTGLDRGAVDRGQGRVTFSLFAPGKQSVCLIGEFNHWDRNADPLTASPEGLWWIEKSFEPGSYTYQFAVDGDTIICDPYARALAEDSAYDPPRAIVEVGRAPYAWLHDPWQRPPFNDLILYEVHVGDFSPEGSFRGLLDRLGHLKELGINAIELMPVTEFEGDLGWGYNPAFFFTVEKSYGSADDLRALIDEAHGQGMAVILDLVLAHTAHRHTFNKLYPYDQSPWYGNGCGKENEFGFPKLDHTKGPTRDFVRDVQAYWLREYHVDGFRYDYCAGIGCCGDAGLSFMVNTAREALPGAYLIAEYGPEDPDAVNACDPNGAWHITTSYALKALLSEGECGDYHWDDFARCLTVLDPWQQGYRRASQAINLMESHDEQRAMRDLLDAGMDEGRAFAKAALGATVLFTMPGQPMLYQGQEWGEATERKTNERNSLHWDQANAGNGRWLLDRYRQLASLRHAHPGLRSEGFSLDATYPDQKAVVYHRWNDEGDEIVIAANFSPAVQTLKIPFPGEGRWLETLSAQTLEVQGDAFVELAPYSARVYTRS